MLCHCTVRLEMTKLSVGFIFVSLFVESAFFHTCLIAGCTLTDLLGFFLCYGFVSKLRRHDKGYRELLLCDDNTITKQTNISREQIPYLRVISCFSQEKEAK